MDSLPMMPNYFKISIIKLEPGGVVTLISKKKKRLK